MPKYRILYQGSVLGYISACNLDNQQYFGRWLPTLEAEEHTGANPKSMVQSYHIGFDLLKDIDSTELKFLATKSMCVHDAHM